MGTKRLIRSTHYKYCNLAPAWALKRAFILSHRKQASGATDKQCDSKQNPTVQIRVAIKNLFIQFIQFKQASKQTSKQENKQASKQTSKQENKQASKQASKHTKTGNTHIMHTHKHTHTGTHRSSKQSSKQYNASKNKEARYFFNSPFFLPIIIVARQTSNAVRRKNPTVQIRVAIKFYLFNSFNSMCVTWCCLLASASKHTL